MTKEIDKEAIALSKAAAHPLRIRILKALGDGVSSPNQLSQELGEPLGNVSYHMKSLVEYGCLRLVKTEPRRGAVEHFYRSTNLLPLKSLSADQRKLVAKVLGKVLESGVCSIDEAEAKELAEARKALV